MNFTLTQWALLLTEWAFGYTVFRIIMVFFDRSTCKNKKMEIISYILFMVINSICFLFVPHPLVRMCFTVLCIFSLVLQYKGNIKKYIFTTILICTILCMVEIVAVYAVLGLQGVINTMKNESGILVAVVVRLSEFTMVLFLERLRNLRRGADVPFSYRIIILLVPLLSIGVLVFMTSSWLQGDWFLVLGIVILEINFLVFYLYDRLIVMREKSEASIITDMEKDSYKKQLAIMQEYMNETRTLRHDAKNHVYVVQSLLEQNRSEAALDYIQQVTQALELATPSVRTGNIELDSLLSFKLSQAQNKQIKVNYEVTVPEHLKVKAFDLAAILGNLFDNAVEALQLLPEKEREMQMTIRYTKGRLLISTGNPYSGTIWEDKGHIHTKKRNPDGHGLGLKSIQSIVEKYQGEMRISTEDSYFLVHIILYTE